MGITAGVRYTARKVSVKVEDINVLDPGGSGWLWGHGMPPHKGGGAGAYVGGGAILVGLTSKHRICSGTKLLELPKV